MNSDEARALERRNAMFLTAHRILIRHLMPQVPRTPSNDNEA
jgi:hypothetical protein